MEEITPKVKENEIVTPLQTTPSKSPKVSKNIFLVAIIVVIVAIVFGIGGYYIGSTYDVPSSDGFYLLGDWSIDNKKEVIDEDLVDEPYDEEQIVDKPYGEEVAGDPSFPYLTCPFPDGMVSIPYVSGTYKIYEDNYIKMAYPDNWYVLSNGNDLDLGFFQVTSLENDKGEYSSASISLYIKKYDPENYSYEALRKYFDNSLTMQTTDITVDAIDALLVEGSFEYFLSKVIYIVKDEKILFTIGYYVNACDETEFNSMLTKLGTTFDDVIKSIDIK